MTYLWQGLKYTLKGVKALRSYVGREEGELFEQTRDREGCPHIEMISGWSQPFNDMIGHLAEHGGIAWKNGDGNSKYYWHPQESFGPLAFEHSETYIGQKLRHPAVGYRGANCERCRNAIKLRGG